LDEGLEDAQAAEITSDERVRTRTPSFFFMTTPLRNRTPAYPWFGEEYTAAPAWIEAARLLKESFRFAPWPCKKGARSPSAGPTARAFEITRFKTRLRPETDEIHSSPAGELLTERGMSPLHYVRRFAMTKMLGKAHPPGPCSGWCPDVVARAVTDVRGPAGFGTRTRDATSDAALNRSDAPLVKVNEVGFLKQSGRYRERVDLEIGKASDWGARWWSRRLVQLYEEAGLVRLDK
jgi:hypothetical protein